MSAVTARSSGRFAGPRRVPRSKPPARLTRNPRHPSTRGPSLQPRRTRHAGPPALTLDATAVLCLPPAWIQQRTDELKSTLPLPSCVIQSTTTREYAMNNASSPRIRHLAACMLDRRMGFAAPAVASPPIPLDPPPPTIDFAAGEACNFPLRLQNSGAKLHLKDFVDKDGDVRLIVAGKGSLITLTNMTDPDSGASITLRAYGVSDEVTFPTAGDGDGYHPGARFGD